MFSVSDQGGLAVAWESRDTREIDRELKLLDDRLFIDPERDDKGVYYTVKFWNGERAPEPVTLVLDWRDADGHPKPLTSQVVSEVQRMMRRGPVDVLEIAEENRQLKERLRAQSLEEYTEIQRDFERHDRTRIMVPRSVGLRMSRDRMRRSGKRV